ncbi:hypothetical protein QFZ26_003501 [Agromyces ramosus]|uniref:Uncharacterized protein n=1 Tax=Agromyces ramosus TaxID=33879 RepID=A0ABU0RFE5_9MICO|nr:hypothetical protein [Agromyces ramosus]
MTSNLGLGNTATAIDARAAKQATGQAVRLEAVVKNNGTGPSAVNALRGIDLSLARGSFTAIMDHPGRERARSYTPRRAWILQRAAPFGLATPISRGCGPTSSRSSGESTWDSCSRRTTCSRPRRSSRAYTWPLSWPALSILASASLTPHLRMGSARNALVSSCEQFQPSCAQIYSSRRSAGHRRCGTGSLDRLAQVVDRLYVHAEVLGELACGQHGFETEPCESLRVHTPQVRGGAHRNETEQWPGTRDSRSAEASRNRPSTFVQRSASTRSRAHLW